MSWNAEAGVVRVRRNKVRTGPRPVAKHGKPEPLPDDTMEWEDLRTLLLKVLDRFPDAKQAVLEALKES